MTRRGVAAVVLAAGGSSRFARSVRAVRAVSTAGDPRAGTDAVSTAGDPRVGTDGAGVVPAPAHKLLAPFRGRPLVSWALESALAAGLERTWVVTGAVQLDGAVPPGVEVIHNPHWERGQASSLQAALLAADEAGLGAVVVGLGDQPMIPPAAWAAVASGPGPIVIASYSGKRRNPVRLDRQVWSETAAAGDEGARSLMRLRPELVREVACAGDPADIDTLEDLHRWN